MFHDYLRTTWAPSTILLLKEEVEAVRYSRAIRLAFILEEKRTN